MNKMQALYIVMLCATYGTRADLYPIDRIIAVADGPTSRAIVTQSDVTRRGFDGIIYDVLDVLIEMLMDQLAQRANMTVDDAEISRYLQKNGVDAERARMLADAWGYSTIDEFYDVLKRVYRASNVQATEMEGKMSVSKAEMEEYYHQHPSQVHYLLETAFVPKPVGRDAQKRLHMQLNRFVQGDAAAPDMTWSEPTRNTREQVAEHLQFILDKSVGFVHLDERDDGFVLVRLKEVQKPSLEDRYTEIMLELRRQKYPQAIQSIREDVSTRFPAIMSPMSSEWQMVTSNSPAA